MEKIDTSATLQDRLHTQEYLVSQNKMNSMDFHDLFISFRFAWQFLSIRSFAYLFWFSLLCYCGGFFASCSFFFLLFFCLFFKSENERKIGWKWVDREVGGSGKSWEGKLCSKYVVYIFLISKPKKKIFKMPYGNRVYEAGQRGKFQYMHAQASGSFLCLIKCCVLITCFGSAHWAHQLWLHLICLATLMYKIVYNTQSFMYWVYSKIMGNSEIRQSLLLS